MATFKRIAYKIFHSTVQQKHFALIVMEAIVQQNEFVALLADDIIDQGANASGGKDLTFQFRICSDQQTGTGGFRVVTLYIYEEIMDPNAARLTKPLVQTDIDSKLYNITCELYNQSNAVVAGPVNGTITQNSTIIID